MNGNNGEIQQGASSLPHNLDVLGLVADGCESGRLIREVI